MPAAEDGAGWQQLYEDAACGLLLTDHDGTIRIANRTFCRWVGYEPDALVGKRRFQELLTMGGRIFHQTHWWPLLHMQGSVAEVKLDLVHHAGHTIPMMLNAVRRRRGERDVHELSVFVAEDRNTYERELMRARRDAERLLAQQVEAQRALVLSDARARLALEAASLHVWELDPATGARDFQPSIALLLGHAEPRAIDWDTYLDAMEPEDREPALAALARLLDRSHHSYRATYRLNGIDGVQRTVLSTARAVLDANGAALRVIGLLQDITELVRERAAAEDRALFAERMVGIASHDLRNPLSAIMLGAELLSRAGLDPPYDRAVEHIAQGAKRSHRLIEDLLDFTVATIGRGLVVKPQPIDLHALAAQAVHELQASYAGAALRLVAVGGGPCEADPERLVQLVGNLVSNAVSYGAPDAPITITSRIEADRCSVSVHNLGRPIPEAVVPMLFRPMVRGMDVSAGGRSVGLGLYIVTQIARAHRGRIVVVSNAQHGTEFTFVFPATVDAAPIAAA